MNRARDAGPSRGEGLAGDRESPGQRAGAEQTRRRSRQRDHRVGEHGREPVRQRPGRRRLRPRRWTPCGRRSPKRCSARCSANSSANSSRSPGSTTRRTRAARPSAAAGTGTSTRISARVLGESVAQPYSRGYCGNGNLEACRELAVVGDPDGGGRRRRQQGPNPATWEAARRAHRIPAGPGGEIHDALDEPLDVPAGDRIHGARSLIGTPARASRERRRRAPRRWGRPPAVTGARARVTVGAEWRPTRSEVRG